ncbi:MAG: type II toxin-antitoxin system death-on-curing family toxin [archaeon]|nr:type II toxin-antitoxin system death-on-curing family toxin [archaeon]MCP8316483.1 type II toxin-antitoxin system death-on-curing family toxin [archaeon]MCP8321259.1 type II toxin-antitoxin system death-on-curing family toxin [archaeon]
MSSEIEYPSPEQVDMLYREIIRRTGGESGYLNRSNLDYILDAVKDVGERLPRKEALIRKAAFLLYNIIRMHPFLNGNKRTAFELTKIFLESNGYRLQSGVQEAFEFVLEIASGKLSMSDIESWIQKRLIPIDHN